MKGPVSENPLTVNVLTSAKNVWNLQEEILTHFSMF